MLILQIYSIPGKKRLGDIEFMGLELGTFHCSRLSETKTSS